MVLIWKMESVPLSGDPRLPYHFFPPIQLPLDKFRKDTGLLYWKLNMDDHWVMAKRLDAIKRSEGLVFEDILILGKDINSDFDKKLQCMFEPRKDKAASARCVLEGSMYLDVHKKCWHRLLLEKGDMVIIPPGVMHRFSTDTRSYVKMKRLFNLEAKKIKDVKERVERADNLEAKKIKDVKERVEREDKTKQQEMNNPTEEENKVTDAANKTNAKTADNRKPLLKQNVPLTKV